MRMPVRGTLAALALGAAAALPAAAPAGAAITVALSPTAGPADTRVVAHAANCDQDATGSLEGTDVVFQLPRRDSAAQDGATGDDAAQDGAGGDHAAQGGFTVPEDLAPGTYTVAVTCGGDTASSKFTVTSGAGAATGGGSTAAAAANAVMWTGAAVSLIAAAGLWLLRRRSVPAA